MPACLATDEGNETDFTAVMVVAAAIMLERLHASASKNRSGRLRRLDITKLLLGMVDAA
jgi:hypothetical protein